MSCYSRRLISFLIVLLASLYSFAALAISCNEASPNFIEEGEVYYDIYGAEPLTKTQEKRIKKLLSRIDGRWTGTASKTHCIGNKIETLDYKLKAEVEQLSDGKLVFSVNSLETQSRTLRDETFRFLGSGNQYHITKLTDDILVLYIKYRRPNATRNTTIFVEEIVEIVAAKKSLQFNITQYLNGHFAEEYRRTLSR